MRSNRESTFSTPGKIFTGIIGNRLKENIEDARGKAQRGFRGGIIFQYLIFAIQIGRKLLSKEKNIFVSQIYKKACHNVKKVMFGKI